MPMLSPAKTHGSTHTRKLRPACITCTPRSARPALPHGLRVAKRWKIPAGSSPKTSARRTVRKRTRRDAMAGSSPKTSARRTVRKTITTHSSTAKRDRNHNAKQRKREKARRALTSETTPTPHRKERRAAKGRVTIVAGNSRAQQWLRPRSIDEANRRKCREKTYE